MILKPVVASYSGQSYRDIMRALDARALDLVARVAESPVALAEVDSGLADDLVEMHVLAIDGDLVRLDTAVFLEEDIRALEPLVASYSLGLVSRIAEPAASLRGERPEIANFVIGVLGIGQTLGHALRDAGIAVDWRSFGGRYANSKVDFDEVCEAYLATGRDLQNKTIQRGTHFSAVFIGPGGPSYLLRPGEVSGVSPEYVGSLNASLTDAFALLVAGKLDSPALKRSAEQVGLLSAGVPTTSVLTSDSIARYLPAIEWLGQVTRDFAFERLGDIRSFLRSTTCGRQGVPVENMILHVWRYLRKGVARQLYARGVLVDAVPEVGLITVFFSNDVETLGRLFD